MTAGHPVAVTDLPTLKILGTRVHGPTLEQALDIIEEWIHQKDQTARVVVATGFHGLWVAHEDPGFREVLNQADLFCPDGIAPVWLSRLQGNPLPGRVPGPDLLLAFLHRAHAKGYRNYFYGDTEETLSALRRQIERQYPGATIAGMHSPPFRALTSHEAEEHLDRINQSHPDILWVGLGCPKQERWVAENREQLKVPVIAGVGAAFRFLAGSVARAPGWLRNSGFEWLWRLGAEPGKLWKRDLIDGPRFVAAAVLDARRAKRHPVSGERTQSK